MERRTLYKTNEGIYHITARTNNKEWYPIPLRDCWNLYGYYLKILSEKYLFKIHGFVLMSNHFHMLVSTPLLNIDAGMNYFMTATSKGIGFASGKVNHLYGGPYFPTLVFEPLGYASVLKYIYRNPLRAKICNKIADYPWTTITNNFSQIIMEKSDFDLLVPKENLFQWIDNLNNFDEIILKTSLKKKKFKSPLNRKTRRRADLLKYIDY